MGGTPLLALAIVGMPLDNLPAATITRILQGGAEVCAQAGIPIAGGHSIDVQEPIYGLVVIGLVNPQNLKKNSAAQAGDVLILGKPLGVGLLSAALKKGQLSDADYATMLHTTTQLNQVGSQLATLAGVHAMTDVTGFGLGGHLLEICRGSRLSATVHWPQVPLLQAAATLAQQGIATGASTRNWASYGHNITLPADFAMWQQKLLTDPQTSGGLLVSCQPQAAAQVLEMFQQAGFAQAAIIGQLQAGAASLRVEISSAPSR
jgi:selenide,water dikinase